MLAKRMEEPKAEQETGGAAQKRSWAGRAWHWLKRLLLSLALLLLLLMGMLQVPAVQNWIAGKVTRSLSNALQTAVTIDRLNVRFLNRLILENFYIEDLTPGDTAVYSRRLYVNFNINPVVLARQGLVVEELALDSATVNLRKKVGTAQNNIQTLLGRLSPPADTVGTTVAQRPFRLGVERLSLSRVRFLKQDEDWGQRHEMYLAEGEATFESFNLPQKNIHAKKITLKGPYIRLDEYERKISEADSIAFFAPEAQPSAAIADAASAPVQPLYITAEAIDVAGGKFSLHNWRNAPVKTTPADMLDYQHMDVFDINIAFRDMSFCSDSLDFEGRIEAFNLRDLSGFVLNELSVSWGRVWNHGLRLYGLNLATPNSEIGDTLFFDYDTYEDFKSFPDEVRMEARLNNASVTLDDIMTFAPGLEGNAFFTANRERSLYVDGLIKGTVNNLDARDMYIALENRNFVAQGNLSTRDLTSPDFRTINLRLRELRTNMRTLRQLFPQFNPPEAFNRLGWLYFTGSFDVFFSDYIAYGELKTALGGARMDMQIKNLSRGRERAAYSGSLDLIDFDLGGFAQNQDLGLVNFSSSVRNGVGLTAESASADLSAEVGSFLYRGYNYENATLTGVLKKNRFEGDFKIQDENIDFSFQGEVDLTDTVPAFNFDASVNRLVMQRLNLSEKDLVLSGDLSLDLRNSSLSELEGAGQVAGFRILHRGVDTILVEGVSFRSFFLPSGEKQFVVASDLLDAKLSGNFDIEDIPGAFMGYLRRNYTGFFDRLGLQPPRRDERENRFFYRVDIKDTKGILGLFEPRLGRISGAKLEGYFDNERDSILVSASIPQFRFGNIQLNEVGLFSRLEDSTGSLSFMVSEPVLNDKHYLSPIRILADLDRDTLDLALAYQSEGLALLDNLNLNAQLFLADSLNYQLRFDQSNLILLETPWLIEADNYIIFRKGYISSENFVLSNKERTIRLETKGQKGLRLAMEKFDFSFIDEIWDYNELDFGGPFSLTAEVDNIFEMKGLQAVVRADTFWVNEDDWGALRLDASAKDLQSPYRGYLALTKDTAQLIAEGYYNPQDNPGLQTFYPQGNQARFFDIDIDVTSFPVDIAEYWLAGTITGTEGRFDTRLDIYGFPGEPHIGGTVAVRNGATTIDFLKTRYRFPEGTIYAQDGLFDATGTVFYDKYGNTARVQGGVTHEYLKNLGLRATLETDRFLALDTGKEDNDLFYGHALGQGRVAFDGPMNKIDIYVNATVGRETRLVIPVSYGSEASELNFINFTQRKQEAEEGGKAQAAPAGVDLEMDLVITEEARGEIIFDEQAGDIIRGKGRGNIRISVPRTGEFQMFGDYVIEEGDYLFTLYNVVNKDFEIKRGGVITWSGDPFEAQIQLEAEYSGLATPVANFIQEYLIDAPEDLRQGASQATDVDLTMDLRGDLLKPVINFDISFPQLTGGLKTMTDSKLRILKQDPNELNRQVFGLIVVGQFLPADLAIQGTDIFYNTVSEFISNQLSLLLTELFSEFFGEQSALSGIDFDIAYNQYQTNFGSDANFRRGDEFQVRLRQEFFNDRLTILVGGNVDIGNNARVPESGGTFVGNDVVIEYVLNRDRTLKLRIYQRLEPDIGGGSRLEIGSGISYRKEFDSFSEFLKSFRKAGRKVRD